MIQKLTTKRWLLIHLVVLAAFIVLLNLGFWQLRRLEQRRTQNRQIAAGLEQPPLTLTDQPVDPDRLHLRRVRVRGTFDNDESIIVHNRPYEQQPGVHLVVPLRIQGSEQAVLVNRGWIPLGEAGEPALAERRSYDISQPITITGIAYPSQTQTGFGPTDPIPSPAERRDAWFRIDIERIEKQLPYPLWPIYIKQMNDARPAEPPLQEGEPVLSEGPHLGYALQWFTMALILLITYAFFIRQEMKES